MKRLALTAALLLCSYARAQNLASPGYRCEPGTVPSFGGNNCFAGSCIYCPSTGPYANTLVTRNASGVDTPLTLPTVVSQAGKVLGTDGTNLQWTANGTLTSVGLSAPNLFSVTGSPITTSGTLAQAIQRRTVTSSVSLSATTDFIVEANCASACTLTLPSAPTGGTLYWIADVSGAAASNNVTVSGAQNINGAATYVINTNYGYVQIEYDTTATKWLILANTATGGGGGSIGGSIALNQVAYGSGTNAIQGSSNFTYNGSAFSVGGGSSGLTTLSLDDGSSAGVCAAGVGCIRYNNSTHIFEQSLNNAAWTALGGATKLTAAYAAGATSGDQTMFIAPGNGGSVQLENDSIGATVTDALVLKNTTTAANNAQQFAPALHILGNQWNGSASVPIEWRVDVEGNNATTNPGNLQFWSNYNGAGWTKAFHVTLNQSLNAGSPFISGDNNTAMYYGIGSTVLFAISPTVNEEYNNMDFYPTGTYVLGYLSRLPALVNSYLYGTQPQPITAGASVTVTPASGGIVRLNLQSATNVTSLTVSAPTVNSTTYDGVTLTVAVIQPSSGTAATVPTTWTGVSFAGGTFTNTATLGKRDYVTLTYDSNTSKWYETARALNLAN